MMDLHQHHKASQGKLILVSNRLPVHVDIKSDNTVQFRSSAGGLATALNGFHKDHSGSLWVGWPGVIPPEHREEVKNRLLTEYGCYPVFLEEDLVEKFYDGFSNNTLWPLFHSFPAYTRYLDSEWEAYKEANEMFAKAILEVASSGDCVWIHDFHIMLLPKILREAMSDLVIGFFLHIPFPSYDIFRLMPWASEITEALLRSDLVGFHTYDYVQNFLAVVRRSLGIDNNLGVIVRDQLVCHVDVFPIGIDFNKFNLATEHPATQVEMEKIKKRHDGQKIIFAVSRLDYTKGIIESLHAFETLLVTQPQYQKKVVFVLVVVPSRERVKRYASLKKEIDESVGRINSKYGSFEWHPVLYLFQSLTFAELTAYYSRADVGLVIPSRDGMNLVAKEYLATKKDAAGVLVLSEMAGSAKELQEALLVNPNSKREVSLLTTENCEISTKQWFRELRSSRHLTTP
jgi:trehalose 6-phosphate synthase/phosphatase